MLPAGGRQHRGVLSWLELRLMEILTGGVLSWLELRLMEILTGVKRLYISFKSLVNDFVYSFGGAALLLLVEM